MGNMLILFDGACNLCNSSVQIVLRYDIKQKFSFASLQSETGIRILSEHHLPPEKNDTFLLLENGLMYQRSEAALRVAKHLSGLWPLLYAFIIVPKFLRDAVYDFIAKNRYRWFGKNETCWLPKPEYTQRFLQ